MLVPVPSGATFKQTKSKAEQLAKAKGVRLITGTPNRIAPSHSAWPALTLASTTDVWLFDVLMPAETKTPTPA